MTHRLWTFRITGGTPFAIQSPGNPALTHDGVLTVCHLLVSDDQANEITAAAKGSGCTVQDARPMETQTLEQQHERRTLLGLHGSDKVWPSAKCSACFWFEPLAEPSCGLGAWTEEAIRECFNSKMALDAMAACPVLEKFDG